MCVFAFIFEIDKKLISILGHYFVDWFNLVFCAKQKKATTTTTDETS